MDILTICIVHRNKGEAYTFYFNEDTCKLQFLTSLISFFTNLDILAKSKQIILFSKIFFLSQKW